MASSTLSVVACREIEAGERSNLIIAVGDLALRYPNMLEPWTSHIYAPLSDPDIGTLRMPYLPPSVISVVACLPQMWLWCPTN